MEWNENNVMLNLFQMIQLWSDHVHKNQVLILDLDHKLTIDGVNVAGLLDFIFLTVILLIAKGCFAYTRCLV